MRHLMGLILAGVLIVGTASNSEAQVSVAVGNPYAGQGLFIGSGFGYPGYGPGYPVAGGYNNIYRGPYGGGLGTFGYNSGYRGFAAPVGGYGYGYGYGVRPYNRGFGYGNPYRGYGYGRGFRPFGGMFR